MKKAIKVLMLMTFAFIIKVNVMHAQTDKADLFLYEGHRQLLQGNNSDAFELFRHSLQLNPKSSSALSELSQYWHYLRNDSMAIKYLKSAIEYDSENYWNKEALVDMYVNAGKENEAIGILEQLSVQFPNKEDVLLMLESLYKQVQDYGNVVKILNRLEVKEGKSEQLSMEKFRIYVQMKDEKKAFEEMRDLAAEYPNDLKYKVLIGDLYVNQGKNDDGLRIYKEVEKEDSNNIYMMASLLNYYTETKQDSMYQVQLKKVCTSPKLDAETRLRFLNSLVYKTLQENKDPNTLIGIFQKVLAMPQEDTQQLELCARFMITLKMPAEKVKPVLNQMLDINPECDLARSQLLQYAEDANDTTEVIRICQPAVDYSVKDPVYYYYLGIAYAQLDSVKLAIKTFKKGFTKVDEKTPLQLVTNMYALMGEYYHKTGDMKHAYECYDSCLLYRPDDALVLNNYAYYLSLENKQLDKAAEMSRRSLAKEGNNYTYLDTYAWILFQQEKYAEAKYYIDSTLILMGDSIADDDSNIIEHAGDIYAKNGFIDKAVEFWQKSLDMGNKSSALSKKLKKRKYLEYKNPKTEGAEN